MVKTSPLLDLLQSMGTNKGAEITLGAAIIEKKTWLEYNSQCHFL